MGLLLQVNKTKAVMMNLLKPGDEVQLPMDWYVKPPKTIIIKGKDQTISVLLNIHPKREPWSLHDNFKSKIIVLLKHLISKKNKVFHFVRLLH